MIQDRNSIEVIKVYSNENLYPRHTEVATFMNVSLTSVAPTPYKN